MEEVHSASCDLLQLLEEEEITHGLGIMALIMTLGRLVSPKVLSNEEETAFLQTMTEFVGLYFAEEGEAN
jgi:hypothetical protein